jgi:hypothetical protein
MSWAGGGDTALFKAVIERVRNGQPYYGAMGAELSARNYPTSSVFNWRTPVVFLSMAIVGLSASWWVLGLLAAALMVLAILLIQREPDAFAMLAGVLALVGAFLVSLAPTMLVHTEGWSGIFIGLSILAYARSSWLTGALLGLLALFVRELAAPYCAVAIILAVRCHRWREISVWTVGGLAFAIFYGFHFSAVRAHQVAGHTEVPYSWVRWGGLPFLLETVYQNNTLLLGRPRVVTAAFVTIVSASLFAHRLPRHARWSTVLYSALFLAIGQPFNDYWGLVTGPTLALCVAFGPAGLSRLLQSARSPASEAVAPN